MWPGLIMASGELCRASACDEYVRTSTATLRVLTSNVRRSTFTIIGRITKRCFPSPYYLTMSCGLLIVLRHRHDICEVGGNERDQEENHWTFLCLVSCCLLPRQESRSKRTVTRLAFLGIIRPYSVIQDCKCQQFLSFSPSTSSSLPRIFWSDLR
ncbi:hypothetical protein BC835DRAFT_653474 [Cytidiella melzeri]|nr:hypothetical protein BC835DRAFT_653474 [Cytidiella melzeri]